MHPNTEEHPMVLHFDTPPPRNDEPVGEAWERHEALLRALRRMGFHDPEALAGPAPPRPSAPALREAA
jgi:hypothetical protein